MIIERLQGNPIIRPDLHASLSSNINGPSLIKSPPWIDDPLGKYYLYFASHDGQYIRLAYADELTGPWSIYSPGTLHIDQPDVAFNDHIASPDVHVDSNRKQIIMYYHGCCQPFLEPLAANSTSDAQHQNITIKLKKLIFGTDPNIVNQFTRVATSRDAINFSSQQEPIGRFYFRVFEHRNKFYALAKTNQGFGEVESGQRLYRSDKQMGGFKPGPVLFNDGARHTAVRRRGDQLDVFYSRIGDNPERILHAIIDLTRDWSDWEASTPEPVLAPTYDWEGANISAETSEAGAADGPVHQLRDPGIFQEGGRTYLLYTVAGERGIALGEVVDGD